MVGVAAFTVGICFGILGLVAFDQKRIGQPPRFILGMTLLVVSASSFVASGVQFGAGRPIDQSLFDTGTKYHTLVTIPYEGKVAALIKNDRGATYYYMLATEPPIDFMVAQKDSKQTLIPIPSSNSESKTSTP